MTANRKDMSMRLASLALAGLLVLGLTACGGAASPTATGPKVTVEFSEFKFAPSNIEVPADQKVTLEMRNRGTVEHDITVDAIGLKAIVKPGQTATRVIGPFAAGTTYEVYCSVAGHKESGMTGKLIAK